MQRPVPGASLRPRFQQAFNYATESENRMHADDGALRYGFRGGLVPGIADYAYLVPTAMEALGPQWASRGWISVKLLKPVYDGERVEVRGSFVESRAAEIALELRNVEGEVCAVGAAGSELDEEAAPDLETAELPAPEDRPDAALEILAPGTALGSLRVEMNAEALRRSWIESFGPSGEWAEGLAAPHPAIYPDLGNRILSSNVLLGPWIHTESRTRHLTPPRWGETVAVRGRVREAFEKRGHEIVHLDVGFFGEDERLLAELDHRRSSARGSPLRLDAGTGGLLASRVFRSRLDRS